MSEKTGRDEHGIRRDSEFEEFRTLMEPPETFEDGFSWATFIGTVFVGLVMVPGSIYMALIAGSTTGPAAQWVTVILFIEVARRTNQQLRNAQIFVLFWLAGAVMAPASAASGDFDGGLQLIWNQFYAQSNAAQAAGIREGLPPWFAPTDPEVLNQRDIFMWEWLPAIGMILFGSVMGKLDNLILGYGLFRVASDVERLPFPMAPIGAQGILALSEQQEEESVGENLEDEPAAEERPSSWRWRIFSMGAVIGILFGAVYMGLPAISGALLSRPIEIIPIPFIDWTAEVSEMLPAAFMALSLDITILITGMVLPFFAMLGSFIGLLVTLVMNPLLYDAGVLTSWTPGDDLQTTFFKAQIDFYFSFGIGISLAVAVVGFYTAVKGIRKQKAQRRAEGREHANRPLAVPEGRGDIKTWIIIVVYIASTLIYIGVSMFLLRWVDGGWKQSHMTIFLLLLFYGFLYTPVISYVTARLEGIAGEAVNIPFVREATFILSGYQGVAIWFIPLPMHNYGGMTMFYRQTELTGTSFWSVWKAQVLLVPLILVATLLFAQFLWAMHPIPSAQFPYAQEFWEVHASQKALIHTATLGGYTMFENAFNPWYLLYGFGAASAAFGALSGLGAPIFLMYGVVRGLNQTLPFVIIPQFIGALLGKFYFQKRFGSSWRQLTPVLAAGAAAGQGLVATLSIGFNFIAKSAVQLPF